MQGFRHAGSSRSPLTVLTNCVSVSVWGGKLEQQQPFSEAAKSRRPDEVLWFLRQLFAPGPLPSAQFHPLPSSHITPHSLRNLCTDRQLSDWGLTLGVHSAKPSDTGAVNHTTLARNPQMCLDKWMRISASQIAIYCATGAERIRSFLPKPCGSAAWPLDGAHWPLIYGVCVAVWECGSGLISLWQRQIEGTDFDNVKKEIRFFPPVYPGRLIRWLFGALTVQSVSVSTLLCMRTLRESQSSALITCCGEKHLVPPNYNE